MKILQIEVSGKMASELEALVKAGWFANENEIAHLALIEFVRRHRFELLEQFQRDDIAWALKQKGVQA